MPTKTSPVVKEMELVSTLKKNLIKDLLRNKESLNKPYLLSNGKVWTRKQLAKEIEKETEMGLEVFSSILFLSIDLTARGKKSPMQRLAEIVIIIKNVDNRCMATDGPVTPTLEEMKQSEISKIYKLATGK